MITSDSKIRVPVEHFGGKQGTGQRGPEDAAHAGADAGGHHDPALAVGKLEGGGQKRTETGTDLGDGPFPAPGPPVVRVMAEQWF
jgi:hypothetical protein